MSGPHFEGRCFLAAEPRDGRVSSGKSRESLCGIRSKSARHSRSAPAVNRRDASSGASSVLYDSRGLIDSVGGQVGICSVRNQRITTPGVAVTCSPQSSRSAHSGSHTISSRANRSATTRIRRRQSLRLPCAGARRRANAVAPRCRQHRWDRRVRTSHRTGWASRPRGQSSRRTG